MVYDTNLEGKISEVAEKLLQMGAYSVFLYGSRATGDALPTSDWEIGVIFEDNKYKNRSEVANLTSTGTVIYPFKKSEIEAGSPTTPFTKSIWLTEIIKTAKTIAGEHAVEQIPLPQITNEDLKADVAFRKAGALDAMIAFRSGAKGLAVDFFVKSCLLGLRDLILLNGGNFPTSYQDIVVQSEKYLPPEMRDLPKKVLAVRQNKVPLDLDLTFQNLELLTKIIDGDKHGV